MSSPLFYTEPLVEGQYVSFGPKHEDGHIVTKEEADASVAWTSENKLWWDKIEEAHRRESLTFKPVAKSREIMPPSLLFRLVLTEGDEVILVPRMVLYEDI